MKRADGSVINPLLSFLLDRPEQCVRLVDFLRDSTLVPIPGSGIALAGQSSPPLAIANRIVEMGLARNVERLVYRHTAVPKSAFASPQDRITVARHYDSIARQEPSLFTPSKLVLVDDVITQGRVSYACFQHLREKYPHLPIGAFSLIRTMNFESDVLEIFKPCVGTVSFNGEKTSRSHNSYSEIH